MILGIPLTAFLIVLEITAKETPQSFLTTVSFSAFYSKKHAQHILEILGSIKDVPILNHPI